MLRISLSKDSDPFERATLTIPKWGHLLTAPNESALISVGFNFSKDEGPLIGTDNRPYFQAMRLGVEAIKRKREELFSVNPSIRHFSAYDTVLTCPGLLKEWKYLKIKKNLPKGIERKTLNMLRDMIRKMRSRPTFSLPATKEQLLANISSPEIQMILGVHAEELQAYTAALSVRASANFVPVIRIPTSVNAVISDLQDMVSAAHTNNPQKTIKISRIMRNVSQKLAAGLPEWILEELRQSKGIKLIADAPLEWIELDSLPMLLRKCVSRITVTPGNLFFGETVAGEEMLLQPEAFDEVLIIRSFRKSDPIKEALTKAVILFQETFVNGLPRVRFIDISNKKDLIKAIGSYRGALMVYDGHARHNPGTDIGTLVLPEEEIDPWSLRGKVRLPPIAVLSACDTHPFAASHSTVANGFLAAGSKTVWATSLPVDARHAAIFIGRLLLRVSHLKTVFLNEPFHAPLVRICDRIATPPVRERDIEGNSTSGPYEID